MSAPAIVPGAAAATAAAPGAREPVPVLHLVNGEFYAGAERVQALLADRLPQFGYRAHFVCLKRGEFQRALEQSAHPCRTLAMRNRFDVLGLARAVAQHAQRSGCRLIHSHTARSALVGSAAAAFGRLPLVHHVHSPARRDSSRRLLNTVNSLVEAAALKRAHTLLPVSESLAGYLRDQGWSASRIVTVPNGVAIDEGPAMPLRQPPRTIGTMALFRPRKGVEVLLEALAELTRRGVDLRLWAVGPFETAAYQHEVETLCQRLGVAERITWRGFRSDVSAELRCMDVLVLPSLFGEGMPMVVLEAMAVGLPVVATRVEGVPEVVRDGRDGVLVAPGEPAALADAVARLAADGALRSALGASARERQRSGYSDLAMAERLARVYDAVLG